MDNKHSLIMLIVILLIALFFLFKSYQERKQSAFPFMSTILLIGIIAGVIGGPFVFGYFIGSKVNTLGTLILCCLIGGVLSGSFTSITYGYFSRKRKRQQQFLNNNSTMNKT